jgi:CheY-like chemotaxis protein
LTQALKAVVVDDEELVREVIAGLLAHEGHHVKQCAGGAEALDYLANNEADLLFADLSMPGMSGVELIEAVLKKDLLPKDRIVAVTGLSFESPDVRWLTARKIFVLFKPFDGAALRWSLDTLLTEV